MPIQTHTNQIYVEKVSPTERASATLQVFTYQAIPLHVDVNLPFLKARIGKTKRREQECVLCRDIIIETRDQTPIGRFDGRLLVKSPEFPNYKVRVSIHFRSHGWLKVSPPTAFFGFVRPGKIYEKVMRVSSQKPFRVKRVESDSKLFDAAISSNPTGISYDIALRFRPNSRLANRVIEGAIQIQTDIPGEENVKLCYYAHVR